MSKSPEVPEETSFMDVLENGVRDVLKNRKSTAAERLQAVTAGTKLLAIKHKVTGEEPGFFDK